MPQVGATRQLADFLAKTNYQDLPGPVIEKTKELITDQLGVALASSTLPWNRKVLEYVQDMGIGGESRVIGTPYRTALEYAALVNESFSSERQSRESFIGRSSWISFLASMVLSRDRAKELLHAVQNLEQMKDINELADLTISG